MTTFSNSSADIYVPNGATPAEAFARVTHLAIGAHQDDLEFMAFPGIGECFEQPDKAFGGVVCADGAGSSRTGRYADYTDEQMRAVRKEEQREAARVGQYAVMAQLDHPSAVIKNPADQRLQDDLLAILRATRAEKVYAHQPADKHETHIAVLRATLGALRQLPMDRRPRQVLGCEVWRGLDWMLDSDKVLLDISGQEELANRLNVLFDSQIAGGKRYDLAVQGRRFANATFHNAHQGDKSSQVCVFMDLTPLVQDDALDIVSFTEAYLNRFRNDVIDGLNRQFLK